MLTQSLSFSIAIMSVVTTATAQTDRTLVHEAVIDAPVADVWRLATTSEGASRWMAPKVIADVRIGGSFRASYHPESNLNDEHTIVNRILTYAPQRMLSIQNVQAPAGFQHMDRFQQTWTVIYFGEEEGDKTRIRMAGLGYGEGPDWDELYQFFEQGNKQVLASLQNAAMSLRKHRDAEDAIEETAHEPATARAILAPITSEDLVNATITDVWRAWTTSEGVKEFLGVNSNIDLRINGPLELYFLETLPEGQRGSEDCRFLAYEPHRMLSFSWNAPPHLPFARAHHTWVVIDFDEVEDEQVRIRLSHYGFEQRRAEHPEHAAEFEAAHAYFMRGWPSVLAKLKSHFDEK